MACSDELRLLWVLALTALVVASAWRAARKINGGANLAAAVDAGLLVFLVQYLAVGVPGMLGLLRWWSVGIVAAGLCAPMQWMGNRLREAPAQQAEPRRAGRWVMVVCAMFAAGFVGTRIYYEGRYAPPLTTDALAYHLPAAAQWLQTGRIGLFPTWFFNPANTFSPLGGSVFAEWWMAPLHNDALARFVQVPGLALLWLALMLLLRELGAGKSLATILATAVVLSRPFFMDGLSSLDDVLLTAFFAVAAGAMGRQWLGQRFGPVRLGIAVGLMLSIKYTALMGLAPLALMIDSPLHARWKTREFAVAGLCALLLAGPWYLRNWIMTGNPVFPMGLSVAGRHILHGPLTVSRSAALRSWLGTWKVLTGGDFGMPAIVMAALLGLWLLVPLLSFRRMVADPLGRAATLGPPLLLAIFVFGSPYAEARFVFPGLLLLCACSAMVLGVSEYARMAREWSIVSIGNGIVLALLCVLTIYDHPWRDAAVLFEAGAVAAAAGGLWFAFRQRLRQRLLLDWGLAAGAVIVVLLLIWGYWHSYLENFRGRFDTDPLDTRRHAAADDGRWLLTSIRYGGQGELWWWIRQQNDDKTVAYADMFMPYAMMGFDLNRAVVYCPVRKDVDSILDIPALPPKLTGEQINEKFAESLNNWDHLDRVAWLGRLSRAKVGYLVIYVGPDGNDVKRPEIFLTRLESEHFKLVFDNRTADGGGGLIYRVK